MNTVDVTLARVSSRWFSSSIEAQAATNLSRAAVYRVAAFLPLLLAVFLLSPGVGSAATPGQWGTTDTSNPPPVEFPAEWPGEMDLRGQWSKLLADKPGSNNAWPLADHLKGEFPFSTYYMWQWDAPLPEGTKILLEGDFPLARWFNIQMSPPRDYDHWQSGYTGINDVQIADIDIVPDPNHVNPFVQGANRKATKRHYHVTFEVKNAFGEGQSAVTINTFGGKSPFLPPYRAPGNLRYGGTKVTLDSKELGPMIWIRIYLPDGYDPYGGVKPPVLRVQYPGEALELALPTRRQAVPYSWRHIDTPYTVAQNPVLTGGRTVRENATQDQMRAIAQNQLNNTLAPGTRDYFQRAFWEYPDGTRKLYKIFNWGYFVVWGRGGDYTYCPEISGLGPNASPPGNDEHGAHTRGDVTYLYTSVNPWDGEVVVIRAKKPQTPQTIGGAQTMGSSAQLRYFSLSGQVGTVGVDGQREKLIPAMAVFDEQLSTDADGYYTLVYGLPQHRPANATAANKVVWRDWVADNVQGLVWRLQDTEEAVWPYAPQSIPWVGQDYCDGDNNPDAVRGVMGEYWPQVRYMTKQQAEDYIRALR